MSYPKLKKDSFPTYVVEKADNIHLNDLTERLSGKTFTVEDVVEAYGFGWFQVRIIGITGILQVANAMEMLLLSVLGPTLRCSWHLNSSEVALITTIVFVGFLLGAPLWGLFSDRFGRKTCFVVVLFLVTYLGLASSMSPNFIWLIVLRGLVGFGVGGEGSSYTLTSEYLPIKYRSKTLMATAVFWAIGSTLEIGLAYLVLPRFGWRWLVFASALPLALFAFFLGWLPESARYLMAANRPKEAEEVIKKLAKSNNCEPLEGRLVESVVTESHLGNLSHLWAKGYCLVTCIQPFLWFGAAFSYYGVVLISSTLFRFNGACYGADETQHNYLGNITYMPRKNLPLDASCCASFTDDDFITMSLSSLGEFVIIPVLMITNDCMGRKPSLALLFLFLCVLYMCLYICVPKMLAITFLFVIRALASGALSMVYLYTTEVYPTTVRSLGLGVCSSVARIGAIVTPFIANVVMPDFSALLGFSIYAGVNLVCAIGAVCLPIETKNRNLPFSIDSEVEISHNSGDANQLTSDDRVK